MTARSLRRLFVALAAVAAFVAAAPAQAVTPGHAGGEAPLVAAEAPTAIPEQYIVVFKTGTSATGARTAKDRARGKGARIQHEYGAALRGFAATLPAEALDEVRRDANVDYVEADQTLRVVTTQSPVTWGLDRIDQPALPLSNSYTYNFDGTGVTVYVIDTGIRFSHAEFAGRAVSGFDAVDGGSADDCNGHGTHVAGTIGGATYGVAKNVTLRGVRVLNCQGSGTTSQVIAGINWVTSHHAAGTPAVANMSLGGAVSSAIDNAVTNSINVGITYAVAAGNSNANACGGSPARVPDALTVGATTMSDARSSFSNFGTCLDIFAPGSGITSAWISNDSATNTISGTSMASPHVAGAAALVLHETPGATPTTVRTTLINKAVVGVLSNIGSGSPNRMLNALNVAPPPPPPPPPPTCATMPYSATGTLSGTGDQDFHPDGTYYYSSGSGIHRGCLDGHSASDFDLYLWKWYGVLGWTKVAQSISTGPDEEIIYNGTPGYYIWRVVSYNGSGTYTFGLTRP